MSLVTLLTVVFFWLVEHARLQRYALSFVPATRRSGWREAWNEVETRLGLWVRGQLTLMVTIGLATGISYTVLGLPSALLLGVFAGIMEGIPLVGPAIGAIPAIIIAATVSPQLMVVVAAVYVILQFVEGNVLVPLVMKNTIGLSPFIVLLSILIGAAVGRDRGRLRRRAARRRHRGGPGAAAGARRARGTGTIERGEQSLDGHGGGAGSDAAGLGRERVGPLTPRSHEPLVPSRAGRTRPPAIRLVAWSTVREGCKSRSTRGRTDR